VSLVLDLDGTLISCEPRQSAVLRAALVACRVDADVSAVWRMKRAGASTRQALISLGVPRAAAEQVAKAWHGMIEAPGWLALDSILPGVVETLRDMRAAGFELALLTARSRKEWVLPQLSRLGLAGCFDTISVVAAADAKQAKTAHLRQGFVPGFFGDTESDMRAADDAQVPFFPVATGQRDETFLASVGRKPIYADLSEAWKAFLAHDSRPFGEARGYTEF